MKMKTTSEGQGPAPTETPPSSSAPATIRDVTPANRADVERRAQQLIGPEFLSQDFWWDALAHQAGTYWLLWPLRDRVQALGRKYHKRPTTFFRKFLGMLKRHRQNLANDPSQKQNLLWFDFYRRCIHQARAATMAEPTQGSGQKCVGELFSLPAGYSQKKVQALKSLLSALEWPIKGRPARDADARKIVNALQVLTALTPGAKRLPDYDKAYELKKAGLSAHQICKQLDFEGYNDPNKSATDRKRIRAKVLGGIQYRK